MAQGKTKAELAEECDKIRNERDAESGRASLQELENEELRAELQEMAFALAYARTELIRAWAQIEMLHNASPADPATQARTARKDEVSARINEVLGRYAEATKLREADHA